MSEQYVIGVDFGSDSVRAAVVNTASGEVAGHGVSFYPRWRRGLYQRPEQGIFRQHPLDYLESLERCIKEAVSGFPEGKKQKIIGLGVDTTGSTPVPVDREGVPLSLAAEFQESENAMFHLWKDHSAVAEAQELNGLFSGGSGTDYSKYQGKYCAEWFWAKILHTVRADRQIKAAAYTWVEHCDWIVGVLCGNTKPETMYHSACAAGHKALWHREWDGLPAVDVLAAADPYLELIRERFGRVPEPATVQAGQLTKEWAEKLGLPEPVWISGSSFDAHAGAVGAGIKEKTMVCTIGTSAVDMLIEKADHLRGKAIQDFGGQADHSILPGYVGIETGQAAFGDIFAWFKKLLMWPLRQSRSILGEESYQRLCRHMEENMLAQLQRQADDLPEDAFCIALEWFNGRRYPDNDDLQKGLIGNLTLGTDAPHVFRALVFGAVCGLKRIIEGFEGAGMEIKDVIAVGGIPRKSQYIMQMMADVLEKEIQILGSDQTCALGAAIYAAVAGGAYQNAERAAANMSAGRIKTYIPDPGRSRLYRGHYKEYLQLADAAERKKPGPP